MDRVQDWFGGGGGVRERGIMIIPRIRGGEECLSGGFRFQFSPLGGGLIGGRAIGSSLVRHTECIEYNKLPSVLLSVNICRVKTSLDYNKAHTIYNNIKSTGLCYCWLVGQRSSGLTQ